MAEWDGLDSKGMLVEAGVYKVVVRVADGVGNAAMKAERLEMAPFLATLSLTPH